MAASSVTANAGSGGAAFRTVTESGGQHVTEVAVSYVDGTPEPVRVSASTPMPCKVTDGTNTMPTGDAVGRAIFHKITDGTSTAAVKAASTAAVGADPALVVALSPNNAAILSAGAKGATTAAQVTSTAEGADHEALDVQLYHGGAPKDPTAVRALTAADVVTVLQGTPTAQVWKSFNKTTAATGDAIWTPASGKKIVITSIQIGAYGATAARCIVWFGAGGGSPDTTYTEGTDQVVIKQSFAPSGNGFPGIAQGFSSPVICANADFVLRITTDAALSVDVVVYGYEI